MASFAAKHDECPICIDTWTDPRALPTCHHTFCLPCLKKFVESKVAGDSCCCPSCRQEFRIPEGGLEALPKEFIHQQQQDAPRAASRLCDLCPSNVFATSYCVDCEQNMCRACLAIHFRTRPTRNHKVIDMADKSINEVCLYQPKFGIVNRRLPQGIAKAENQLVQLEKERKAVLEVAHDEGQLKEIDMRLDLLKRGLLVLHGFKDMSQVIINVLPEGDLCHFASDLLNLADALMEISATLPELTATCDELGEDLPNALINNEVETPEIKLKQANTKPEEKTLPKEDNKELSEPPKQKKELHSVAPSFLNPSKIFSVITGGSQICAVAVVGKEVFVARHEGSHIEYYDWNSPSPAAGPSLLKIADSALNNPRLAACSHKCLYVSTHISGFFSRFTSNKSVIHRIELPDKSVKEWKTVKSWCTGLSITSNDYLIVTAPDPARVREYNPVGSLIREIILDRSIDTPLHCLQLSNGNFVVSHGGQTLHRVCIVDAGGNIIQSYGGSPASGQNQLNYPCQLTADKHDHIFVADCKNDRVQLLNPTLSHIRTVQKPEHQLRQPSALHFDEINGHLFVGEDSGRLLVFDPRAL